MQTCAKGGWSTLTHSHTPFWVILGGFDTHAHLGTIFLELPLPKDLFLFNIVQLYYLFFRSSLLLCCPLPRLKNVFGFEYSAILWCRRVLCNVGCTLQLEVRREQVASCSQNPPAARQTVPGTAGQPTADAALAVYEEAWHKKCGGGEVKWKPLLLPLVDTFLVIWSNCICIYYLAATVNLY